ncbi:hypothetical protein TrVE_jg4446 [Triparma verrucosa]|uniref:Uncharacterized protein n=1 Tax=Triparma verrucosa TaxID=1606542 RepID=A0A9W7B945_9STRA|nr:hypothetical protein TrVE_jg4446 [Triparma verrucosa]
MRVTGQRAALTTTFLLSTICLLFFDETLQIVNFNFVGSGNLDGDHSLPTSRTTQPPSTSPTTSRTLHVCRTYEDLEHVLDVAARPDWKYRDGGIFGRYLQFDFADDRGIAKKLYKASIKGILRNTTSVFIGNSNFRRLLVFILAEGAAYIDDRDERIVSLNKHDKQSFQVEYLRDDMLVRPYRENDVAEFMSYSHNAFFTTVNLPITSVEIHELCDTPHNLHRMPLRSDPETFQLAFQYTDTPQWAVTAENLRKMAEGSYTALEQVDR